jgi:hypothetical protein
MEWKWTIGEPYERSKRRVYSNNNDENININELNVNELNVNELNELNRKQTENAYTSSLNYDENTWDILNQSIANDGFKISNKREELGTKMADRELLKQIGYNPFLGENNYVDNISISDQFLKPVNTTTEKENNA